MAGRGKKISPEDLERIKQLWADGLSGAQIGILVGRSRGSIVGAASRYGFQARDSLHPTHPNYGFRVGIYKHGPKTGTCTIGTVRGPASVTLAKLAWMGDTDGRGWKREGAKT